MKFTNGKGSFIILQTFMILIIAGSCGAYGCTNRKLKLGTFHFFNFPHCNPELLQKWVQTM